MREHFLSLGRYNRYANERILEKTALVSSEQFFSPSRFERSLHELLFHTMRTEWVWRNLAQNGVLPGPPLQIAHFPSFNAIEVFWNEEQDNLQSLLEGTPDEDLDLRMDLTHRDGSKSFFLRWQMLNHLFLHSMQHRAEAAALLTGYDQSPGDLDYIYYISA